MALPVVVKMRLQSINLLMGSSGVEDSYALSFAMDLNEVPPAGAKSVNISVTGDQAASGDFVVGYQYDMTLSIGTPV
jgi:hypothetical protein